MYQKHISPIMGQRCRYYPSCSQYSQQCFGKYSFLKAFFKTIWRILRCNPFSDGGVDHP